MRNVAIAGTVALALSVGLVAQSSDQVIPVQDSVAASEVAVARNETPQLWFVELSSAPAADGTSLAALEQEEEAFHAAAGAAGIRYSERRHFRSLFNGLSIRADARNLSRLRSLPGVQAVYPVITVTRDQEGSVNVPELTTALAQTGADVAQNTLGLTGAGVRVAVMDTGIDYNHPDLGGCFGPGCRVARGYDFVGDAFNADETSPTFNPVPAPDNDPDDCNGHGTHVAGIIGANGTITGVAPGATFHAYRVFGCEGSTTSDIMLEAMERALDDHSDVLNMSIGSSFQWPQYPTAQGADRLVRRGVVVVASIGNSGANGLYSASAPGVGREVIGVASFDNTLANLTAFTITPDNRAVGYGGATGAPPAPLTGTFPMAKTGTPTTTNDGCNPLAPGSLTDKVALIRRGTCTFYQKAFNAQSAGAAGVVLYNNAAGRVSPTVAGSPVITIPVVAITAADGVLIDGRLASGPVDMTWTSLVISEPIPTAGLISSFSSYGDSPDLTLKPDIGAPGGQVRSTLPLEQGAYGILSGTSMSSPHVAGGVALLLEARPHTRARDVRDMLQNSADPHLWWGNPGLGFLDNVHRQGAGMLDIPGAVLAEARVTPGKLGLGELETAATTATRRIRVARDHEGDRRRGREHAHRARVTYTLGHQPALATGANTFAPAFFGSVAGVSFSTPSITVRDDDDAWVDVTFTPPASANARLFGGYITLTPDDGSPVLRVPYSGYNGDYQAIQVLTPTPNGFPWLAKVVGTNLVNQPGGGTFSMVGDDVPQIVVHQDHQSRSIEMEVIDVATGASKGLAFDLDYNGRNSAAASFFVYAWDGTATRTAGRHTFTRTVPDGTYRLELRVLKALGNPVNPAHTEHWISPDITIARVPPTP